ncbi:hypothetical protein [Glycomyces mayteni]|nr:hypothetical protein GCM10025732_29890 [Glycomyces mayteni]
MAVIGGLLVVIGGELVAGRLRDIRLVLRTSWLSSAAMIVTFACTTQMPLQRAIFVGVRLSFILFAVQAAKNGRIVELVPLDDGDFRAADAPADLPSGRTTVLQYVGSGFFAEVNRLEEEWPHTANTHDAALVISLKGSAGIPSTTFLKSLDRLIERWHDNGVEVIVCGVPEDLKRRLEHHSGDHLRNAIIAERDGVLACRGSSPRPPCRLAPLRARTRQQWWFR